VLIIINSFAILHLKLFYHKNRKEEKMKYYLDDKNRISLLSIGKLPYYFMEVTLDEGVNAGDYNNDVDKGGNKYIIDENVVKLRPLSPAEIEAAEQLQAQADLDAKMSKTITPRQLRLYLLQEYNITSAQLDALVAENEAAKIELEYATKIVRANPLIAGFAQQLGLTDANIDKLFEEAKEL
jgi:hypothetical protein